MCVICLLVSPGGHDEFLYFSFFPSCLHHSDDFHLPRSCSTGELCHTPLHGSHLPAQPGWLFIVLGLCTSPCYSGKEGMVVERRVWMYVHAHTCLSGSRESLLGAPVPPSPPLPISPAQFWLLPVCLLVSQLAKVAPLFWSKNKVSAPFPTSVQVAATGLCMRTMLSPQSPLPCQQLAWQVCPVRTAPYHCARSPTKRPTCLP